MGYCVGMDVGGTNLRVALGDTREDGAGHVEKLSRQAVLNGEQPARRLADFLRGYCSAHRGRELPELVVIGLPATLDAARQKVLQAPNIPGLDGLTAREIAALLGAPVLLEKDVDLLFYRDIQELGLPGHGLGVGVYVGTGIGNALFYHGQPLPGKNGVSGELGHIPRQGGQVCGCGNLGCAECSASGKHLVRLGQALFPQTPIQQLFVEHGDAPEIIGFVEEIAKVVATEVNILDPDYLVLGGGVLHMEAFPRRMLVERILAHTRKPYPAGNLTPLFAKENPAGGALGGLALARRVLAARGEVQPA